MKPGMLILMSFFICAHVIAQADANYTGPAKMYVKSFWSQAELLKSGKGGSAGNLERQLKNIIEKDPAYNTTSLEAEVKTWKEKADQAIAEKKAAQQEKKDKFKEQQDGAWKKINDEKLLETVLDGTLMQVGVNNLSYVQQAMDEYKKKADEALAMDKTKYAEKIADLKRYVDRSHTLAADRIMESAKTILKDVKDAENFEPIVKELQFRQLYWDAARKIYAGDIICEKYYQSVTDLLKKIGSPDDIKKTAAKNDAAAIKERRLPEPVVKDAALEMIMITGFNKKYAGVYKGTALKVVLTQDGWTIERNNISGIVTGRNRTGKMVYKGNDGKCYLLASNVFIYQAYIGGSFSNTEVIYNGLGGEEILCENVK